jgi:hypothetical protein
MESLWRCPEHAVAETNRTFDPGTGSILAPVGNGVGHPLQGVGVDWTTVEMDNSGDSTHCFRL